MGELLLTLLIEGLREQMIDVANQKGSLAHPSVVEISQRLDKYIMQLQKLQRRKVSGWRDSAAV